MSSPYLVIIQPNYQYMPQYNLYWISPRKNLNPSKKPTTNKMNIKYISPSNPRPSPPSTYLRRIKFRPKGLPPILPNALHHPSFERRLQRHGQRFQVQHLPLERVPRICRPSIPPNPSSQKLHTNKLRWLPPLYTLILPDASGKPARLSP